MSILFILSFRGYYNGKFLSLGKNYRIINRVIKESFEYIVIFLIVRYVWQNFDEKSKLLQYMVKGTIVYKHYLYWTCQCLV